MSNHCRSCDAEVIWVFSAAKGLRMPLDKARKVIFTISRNDAGQEIGTGISGHESHFATCPQADEHRKS